MIIRELKLKLTKSQESTLNEWLWILTGVYNWGVRKIELNAKNKIYFSKFDFQNLLANHGKKLCIPSHTLQGILIQSWMAWDRCFKKISKEPKLKSVRNKLNSIPLPDIIPLSRIVKNKIKIYPLHEVKYYKHKLPQGKIKQARIIKRASGWYCQLTIDTIHTFKVKETETKVGIDTGFKTLVTLSDGTKYDNSRYFIQSQKRLAQAQRGKNKKLVARINERIKNQRKDYNHKVSRKIVEDYKEIYITNDNLRGQSKIFGKSVCDAGISQLRNFTLYKSSNCGRMCSLIDSKFTTMICSSCGARSGPKGLIGLKVRCWECNVCGETHDRDINGAINTLNVGLGISLVSNTNKDVGFKQEPLFVD